MWSCFELNNFFTLSSAGCSTFSLNLETERMIRLWYGWLEDQDVAVN